METNRAYRTERLRQVLPSWNSSDSYNVTILCAFSAGSVINLYLFEADNCGDVTTTSYRYINILWSLFEPNLSNHKEFQYMEFGFNHTASQVTLQEDELKCRRCSQLRAGDLNLPVRSSDLTRDNFFGEGI